MTRRKHTTCVRRQTCTGVRGDVIGAPCACAVVTFDVGEMGAHAHHAEPTNVMRSAADGSSRFPCAMERVAGQGGCRERKPVVSIAPRSACCPSCFTHVLSCGNVLLVYLGTPTVPRVRACMDTCNVIYSYSCTSCLQQLVFVV